MRRRPRRPASAGVVLEAAGAGQQMVALSVLIGIPPSRSISHEMTGLHEKPCHVRPALATRPHHSASSTRLRTRRRSSTTTATKMTPAIATSAQIQLVEPAGASAPAFGRTVRKVFWLAWR